MLSLALLCLLAPASALGRSQALNLLPFPNDAFTVTDKSTPTGKRLHFTRALLPSNAQGASMFNADYNRFDGFSPGSVILAKVPGFDTPAAYRRTRPVPITDLAQSNARRAPILVVDAKTARRQLIWTELDSNARLARDTLLEIHPGKNVLEGHRYVVVLRNLKNASGRAIGRDRAFAAALRRPSKRYASILKTLARAGVSRSGLVNAWDFTVASQKSLTSRALSIRDDAFRQLGDTNLADGKVDGSAPAYQVTQVQDLAPCGGDGCQAGESDAIARKVTGTYTVPCYLDQTGCPTGSHYRLSSTKPSARPVRTAGNTQTASFICNIPRSASPSSPARVALYGHGLLGSNSEVSDENVTAMGNEHNFVFCATYWYGMSSEDIPTAVGILKDLSKFPQLVDRLQQGFVDQLYLGRLLVHPQGFTADPAFQVGGQSLLNTGELYYDGNSQGGIFGGVLTALSPDFRRAVLGVPAMNYSVLLPRSTDFTLYASILYPAYPDDMVHPLALDLIQLMWDRGEPDGFAAHMTTAPLPNTPTHKVLMTPSYGDFQVTTFQAEVEARTIGASGRVPVLDPGRSVEKTPFYAIKPISAYPFDGSAIVMWDSGPGNNAKPTLTNLAPVAAFAGKDPHSHPRKTPADRELKSQFLAPGGRVVDVCGGMPCHSAFYTP